MRINLHKLMVDRKIDRKDLAAVLFPGHKYSAVALTRLLSGRSKLGEEQIYRLSIFTGLSIDALYADTMQWKQTSDAGFIRFTMDQFRAVYAPANGVTKIYHLEKLLATHILSKPNQPLSDYLREITDIVVSKSINNK